MKTYQFVQTVYHYYEVAAESLEQAYDKTSDLMIDDCYDVVIGEWQECTPEGVNDE